MVHGCVVYTERAETAAVSPWHQPRNNQTALYEHHSGYSKRAIKKLQSLVWNHMQQKRSESAREQRIVL